MTVSPSMWFSGVSFTFLPNLTFSIKTSLNESTFPQTPWSISIPEQRRKPCRCPETHHLLTHPYFLPTSRTFFWVELDYEIIAGAWSIIKSGKYKLILFLELVKKKFSIFQTNNSNPPQLCIMHESAGNLHLCFSKSFYYSWRDAQVVSESRLDQNQY